MTRIQIPYSQIIPRNSFPGLSVTLFPRSHLLAPPSFPIGSAPQVHLTLLKSAEINYDLTGSNAYPSSIFRITDTPPFCIALRGKALML